MTVRYPFRNRENRMYQIFVAIIVLVVSGTVSPSTSAARHSVVQDRSWHAATYRGLTIGKSSRADMLGVFGTPTYSGPSADQDEPQPIIWNDYGVITGELSGRLAVEVDSRSNLIVGITITPEHMSRNEAIAYFGNDYVSMGYEFCPGFENEEVAPLYENPNSSTIDYMEYRTRGIAIRLNDRGNVTEIYFVSEPFGLASKEDCKTEINRQEATTPR